MSPFMYANFARDLSALLTEDCHQHSSDTHESIQRMIHGMRDDLSFRLLSRCNAMTPQEVFFTENAIVRTTVRTLRLYESPASHGRFNIIELIIELMPLAIAVSNARQEPPTSAEDNLVHFVTERLNPQSELWRDGNAVRGRYLSEVAGSSITPERVELKWLGEHSMELAPHVPTLQKFKTLDRKLCESLLATANPLISGVL